MLLGEDIERQSTCELEVDVVAADILNRLEVVGKINVTSYYILFNLNKFEYLFINHDVY